MLLSSLSSIFMILPAGCTLEQQQSPLLTSVFQVGTDRTFCLELARWEPAAGSSPL